MKPVATVIGIYAVVVLLALVLIGRCDDKMEERSAKYKAFDEKCAAREGYVSQVASDELWLCIMRDSILARERP